MKYEYADFLDKLSELHPDVEPTALKAIVKKGLFGINKVMREGHELIIRGSGTGENSDWIKFLIPMTPEAQAKHASKNYLRKHSKKTQNIEKDATNTTISK